MRAMSLFVVTIVTRLRYFAAVTTPFRGCLALALALAALPAARADTPLRLSLYATAGDVLQHLASAEGRAKVSAALRSLPVSRVFLEGRRGDEYVAPSILADTRDFLEARGIRCAGGIATVPGVGFGVRQDSALGWLNWQNAKTQQDVARFFTENAPHFDELIVDDFYCTADTSPESAAARGDRSWDAYRRDLLVSLIEPMMGRAARQAHPGVRLILKYPQWYDRFHLFGYDPQRMSPFFDAIWVGTEVRDPKTRRMGFVQPTEGYMNFRWLSSVAGEKVVGAWFDHIECSAQNFVDQAYQSVLAGARELTLFHLGDPVAGHPGDALLAAKWSDLAGLAEKLRGRQRNGIVFYKPPDSESAENMYLADYLGMLGLPVLPESRYPVGAGVVFLGVQAAADTGVLGKVRSDLERGATVVMTPAFLRGAGKTPEELAGVRVAPGGEPILATGWPRGGRVEALPAPLEMDGGIAESGCSTRIVARVGERSVPLLTELAVGKGRVVVMNVRTFSEEDFRGSGEWLLAPRALGWPELPESLANELRTVLLAGLGVRFRAPAGVGLYLFGEDRCCYNFRAEEVQVVLDGAAATLPASGWIWRGKPPGQ